MAETSESQSEDIEETVILENQHFGGAKRRSGARRRYQKMKKKQPWFYFKYLKGIWVHSSSGKNQYQPDFSMGGQSVPAGQDQIFKTNKW